MSAIVRFKVTYYCAAPERCEFVRETAHYLVQANGYRQAKQSSYYSFYKTEQEALHAIELRNRKEADRKAQRRIEGCGPELLTIAERLSKWDTDYPVNCHNGYAGLKELDAIIADARALIVKAKGEPA